jgi:hypothetical protein
MDCRQKLSFQFSQYRCEEPKRSDIIQLKIFEIRLLKAIDLIFARVWQEEETKSHDHE